MANKELEQKIIAELSAPLAAEFERDAIEELARATGLRARDGRLEVATALWTAGCRMINTTEIPWNGEGLPPVGLEVEAWYSMDTLPGWKSFKLKYYSEESVIFEGLGETYRDRETFDRYGLKFRPIRTAEQLAAEEREQHRAAIMAELNRLWDADTKRSDFLESVYALIVEAGAK